LVAADAVNEHGTYDTAGEKLFKYEFTNGVNGVKCTTNKKVIHYKGMGGNHL